MKLFKRKRKYNKIVIRQPNNQSLFLKLYHNGKVEWSGYDHGLLIGEYKFPSS